MSVEGFVFDVDDTLYLERDYVRSGFAAVGGWAEEEGLPNIARTCWVLFTEGARGNVFDRALAAHGVPPSSGIVDALVNVYRTHRPMIELLPDARRALEGLVKADFKVAVITGGPVQSQERKVNALGLGTWCEPIVFSGMWGPEFDKPHARSFETAEKLSGMSPSQLCYVADNPSKDFSGAIARGWTVLRVRRPGGLHAHADSEVPECSELDLDRLLNMTASGASSSKRPVFRPVDS